MNPHGVTRFGIEEHGPVVRGKVAPMTTRTMGRRELGRPLDQDIDRLLKISQDIAEKTEALRWELENDSAEVGRINGKADALRQAIKDAYESLDSKA